MTIDVLEGAETNTHMRFVAGSTVANLPIGQGVYSPASIPSSQIYYWTMAWQRGEVESAEDRAAGRTERFGSADDAIRWLLSSD